jgi:hypothetical protein
MILHDGDEPTDLGCAVVYFLLGLRSTDGIGRRTAL